MTMLTERMPPLSRDPPCTTSTAAVLCLEEEGPLAYEKAVQDEPTHDLAWPEFPRTEQQALSDADAHPGVCVAMIEGAWADAEGLRICEVFDGICHFADKENSKYQLEVKDGSLYLNDWRCTELSGTGVIWERRGQFLDWRRESEGCGESFDEDVEDDWKGRSSGQVDSMDSLPDRCTTTCTTPMEEATREDLLRRDDVRKLLESIDREKPDSLDNWICGYADRVRASVADTIARPSTLATPSHSNWEFVAVNKGANAAAAESSLRQLAQHVGSNSEAQLTPRGDGARFNTCLHCSLLDDVRAGSVAVGEVSNALEVASASGRKSSKVTFYTGDDKESGVLGVVDASGYSTASTSAGSLGAGGGGGGEKSRSAPKQWSCCLAGLFKR
jgi:hypothetical protein